MSSPFANSIFHFLLSRKNQFEHSHLEIMGGVTGSRFLGTESLSEVPVVVFDFETTGLDVKTSKIIEIGAIKYIGQKEVGRFSQLINPMTTITEEITKITGINASMLEGQPLIQQVLPAFHDFLRGCVGFAHNAEFDVGMLYYESYRLGITCDYTVFCTLKMARNLLQIERRNLDSLALHYGLTFESRHRSIGDILVTAGVLWRMLQDNPQLTDIQALFPFKEEMPT